VVNGLQGLGQVADSVVAVAEGAGVVVCVGAGVPCPGPVQEEAHERMEMSALKWPAWNRSRCSLRC
jgi:hypothetical protein